MQSSKRRIHQEQTHGSSFYRSRRLQSSFRVLLYQVVGIERHRRALILLILGTNFMNKHLFFSACGFCLLFFPAGIKAFPASGKSPCPPSISVLPGRLAEGPARPFFSSTPEACTLPAGAQIQPVTSRAQISAEFSPAEAPSGSSCGFH